MVRNAQTRGIGENGRHTKQGHWSVKWMGTLRVSPNKMSPGLPPRAAHQRDYKEPSSCLMS